MRCWPVVLALALGACQHQAQPRSTEEQVAARTQARCLLQGLAIGTEAHSRCMRATRMAVVDSMIEETLRDLSESPAPSDTVPQPVQPAPARVTCMSQRLLSSTFTNCF